MITALIFDFDGLLVDTETPAFESWRAIYAEHGHELTLDLWKDSLGTSHGFDPQTHLAALVGQSLDRDRMLARRRANRRSNLPRSNRERWPSTRTISVAS